ncbi:MAG: MBL fold metallo-hydrolase [Dehalococcoidia bacterium]|jgi:glyoxylase-like metal-dependent hydrolase (beta-lactamase superfamily II)|nr:MBL fold metallo-hydrolase [Dehalococcoidia bacterium]
MPNLDVLTYGFGLNTDQGSFGYSTISLLTVGNRNIVVDTGPTSRRGLLFKALQTRNLTPDDIDTVILTHLHWDHCQNTDLFRNARVLVHPTELDYARNPNRGDFAVAWYVAETLDKARIDLISDGDSIAEGVSVIDTPGHTKGHISIIVGDGDEGMLLAGDALPDSGTVKRGLPYNVFWDVEDARASVEKMVHSSKVFYPGHDRPFRLDGEEINYLHGPSNIEVYNSTEGSGIASLTFTVSGIRPVNIDIVQK